MQNKLPGRADEAKKDAQVAQADLSAKADQLMKDAKGQANKADASFEKYKVDAEKRLEQGSKEAADKANSAIDKFDKSVTEVSAMLEVHTTRLQDADSWDRARAKPSRASRAGLVGRSKRHDGSERIG